MCNFCLIVSTKWRLLIALATICYFTSHAGTFSSIYLDSLIDDRAELLISNYDPEKLNMILELINLLKNHKY